MPVLQITRETTQESEELVKFREEWKREVQQKKGHTSAEAQHSTSSNGPSEVVSPSSSGVDTTGISSPISPSKPPVARHGRSHSSHSASAEHSPTIDHHVPLERHATSREVPAIQFSDSLRSAVEVYTNAIRCEQESKLDEALVLYRKAFRMDSNVDKAYNRMETVKNSGSGSRHQHQHQPSRSNEGTIEDVTHAIRTVEISSPPNGKRLSLPGVADALPVSVIPHTFKPQSSTPRDKERTHSGSLASLISTWPQPLNFEPEDETELVHLTSIPDELLVLILRCLDHNAVERFATINRRARVVTLDGSIWRDFVETIYRPPQIADDEDIPMLLAKYSFNFRRMYIEHPRLRLDGVYIAVCHYIRAGQSETAWINISHLITYHRYLRFYPDGQVLSLLANEELSPQQMIPLLKPTLRMKGFFIGNWYLDGTTVHITDLIEPGGNPEMRYSFKMVLALRSRPLGRWNRLDFQEYDSVNMENGEITPVALKHDRPFWFSKVRSYV